jgi:hypothetical protein
MTTPNPSATGGLDLTNMSNEDLMKLAQGGLSTGTAASSGSITDNSVIKFGISKEGTPNYLGGSTQGTFDLQYSKARGLPTTWNQSELRQFVNTGILRKIPGFDVGMGMPEILAAWDDQLKSAWGISQTSGKTWTPFDVMNSYSNSGNKFGTVKKGDWEYDVATGERVRYLGKLTKTTTQKSVDLTSPEDARALTTSVLTQALGRAPTAKEFSQYRASINALERANPTSATTTTTYNPNLSTGELETTSSNTTTTGGVSAEALQNSVLEGAKDTSEYGKYQAATTYWDAMMQMMNGGS